MIKRAVLSIIVAGIWITFSEFVRNEFLLKSYWVDHFSSMGMRFATLPINGILWMVWSIILAFLIFELLLQFSFRKTVFLAWLPAFVMMWITIYNLQVLPLKLIIFVIPLSIVEVLIAAFIVKKFRKS